jgi:transposase
MLTFSGSLKVFLALAPCDMRAGFERLHGLVTSQMKEDVKNGALFIFTNRRRTRIKILYFDGSGLWLMTKRLEKGTFAWPHPGSDGQVTLRLTPEALALLTDGIDLDRASPRRWYDRGL